MTIAERESLRAAIAALGFDEVRFAAAARPPADEFRSWLAAGNYADMEWLSGTAEKRLDPAMVLSGVRSIVMLGVSYASRETAGQQRWAKYALWADYHDTLERGLKRAAEVLASATQTSREDQKIYVDTGPLLERGWAAAAGLGWRGKNAMLVSRTHGNWLLLAAILSRAEIPPDEPLAPPAGNGVPLGLHCGSCTRCLQACPTDAFPRPGWVDSRRCISYHTIENRGVIPRELRAAFGGRLFGCDVCLDVCPWNRFAQEGRRVLLASRADLAQLSLLDLLALDEAEFHARFRRTPVKRLKLPRLLRNACVVAGNWHGSREWHFGGAENLPAVIAAVEPLCAHESELVRAHAVWAMFRLCGPAAARQRLAQAREVEPSACVRDEYAAWEGE